MNSLTENEHRYIQQRSLIPPHLRRKATDVCTPEAGVDVPIFPSRTAFLNNGIRILGGGVKCDICLETGLLEAEIQKCGHRFCVGCTCLWATKSTECAMCRTELFVTNGTVAATDFMRHPIPQLDGAYSISCPAGGCELRFPAREALAAHILSGQANHHICPDHIDRVFETTAELTKHRLKRHMYDCPACDFVAKSKSGQTMLRHMKHYHRNMPLTCDICGTESNDPSEWWKHKQEELANAKATAQGIRPHEQTERMSDATKNEKGAEEKENVLYPRATHASTVRSARTILGSVNGN